MHSALHTSTDRSLELLRRFVVWGCAAAVIAAGPALPALGL